MEKTEKEKTIHVLITSISCKKPFDMSGIIRNSKKINAQIQAGFKRNEEFMRKTKASIRKIHVPWKSIRSCTLISPELSGDISCSGITTQSVSNHFVSKTHYISKTVCYQRTPRRPTTVTGAPTLESNASKYQSETSYSVHPSPTV